MTTFRSTKMQIVQLDATCSNCETGALSFVQQVEQQVGLYVKEPKFLHRCNTCNSTALLDAQYPQHQMVPVEG